MKQKIYNYRYWVLALLVNLFSFTAFSQAQWKIVQENYSAVDPDGAGPAVGVVTFSVQVHAIATPFTATDISVGFSYQTAKAMLPTPVTCAVVSNPANIAVSPEFSGAGYTYTTVGQCNVLNLTLGAETFTRIVAGSLDPAGGSLLIGTTFVKMFTVTLWALSPTYPQAGYVIIHSSGSGTPGPLGTYSIADNNGLEVDVNSLSYSTPVALGAGGLPVLFTNYKVSCNDKGALLTWGTATESNSSRFEIQKSTDGANFNTVDNVAAAGNSTSQRNYQYLDLVGGPAYYRIRQVDRDGQYTYTAVARATCEGKNFNVVIYPVPARDKINVAIRADKSVRTDLQVFDVNGKLLRKINTQINNGTTNIVIDISTLPAGQYMLTSSDPDIIINKKFTVAK